MSAVLQGRAAVITGANQGLGLEIAKHFVAAGADVLLCARNAELLEASRAELARLAKPGQRVLAQGADVAKPADVQALADRALREFPQVHILVNNAGVHGPRGPVEEAAWEPWVEAIHINLMGSVLLCRALLPHFKQHKYGRIVQLSGGGATSPMPFISAYAASKAAVVRFSETLAEEVRSFGITVNAIAPGALNTRMLDDVLQEGPEKVGAAFYEKLLKQKAEGGAPIGQAAALAVFLASDAAEGITGKLISAVWDPWRELTSHLPDVQKTDVYTLRRIGPADRGLTWGNS